MTLTCIHGHNINNGESTCEDGHSIHEPAAALTLTPQELQNIIQGATISADKLVYCARCHTRSTGHTSISTATSQHQKARATYH